VNIAVIGTGYVGLVSGACFAEFGTHVTCVDNNASKVEALRRGEIPIYEPGLDQLVTRNVAAGRLNFTTDLATAVRENLALFICVGTPQDPHGRADLSSVMAVAKSIAEEMEGYKVIVVKSTVPVGTGDRVEALVREITKGTLPFSVASNPEFLREGAAIEDFMRPNRVVIGTEDEQARAILVDLYRPLYLIETPILATRRRASELIKYASNAFLAVKVSYINEMADLCEKAGVDVHEVARGMGLDNRIGGKFLHPGPGYGGSCFPKDTRAILATAEEFGAKLEIIAAAVAVNDHRPARMVEKIKAAMGGVVKGKTVALLGLAFKPNTDDVRESPAIEIANGLIAAGATIRAYDPEAMATAKAGGYRGETCPDEYAACQGADALVLATEWNQFRNLDLKRVQGLLTTPTVVDLRNVYRPADMKKLGFDYTAVGR
jgi:UDPglucose 6-dehydrogenase